MFIINITLSFCLVTNSWKFNKNMFWCGGITCVHYTKGSNKYEMSIWMIEVPFELDLVERSGEQGEQTGVVIGKNIANFVGYNRSGIVVV